MLTVCVRVIQRGLKNPGKICFGPRVKFNKSREGCCILLAILHNLDDRIDFVLVLEIEIRDGFRDGVGCNGWCWACSARCLIRKTTYVYSLKS
jgi:hypothetical protein